MIESATMAQKIILAIVCAGLAGSIFALVDQIKAYMRVNEAYVKLTKLRRPDHGNLGPINPFWTANVVNYKKENE